MASVAAARVPIPIQYPPDVAFLNLSGKDKHILLLLSQGASRSDIAVNVGCSMHAIHAYINRMVHREGCNSITHLVARYLEEYHGLLDPIWNKI